MSVVSMVSGGLDSAVVAALLHKEGVEQWPLFVNYGQLNFAQEVASCRRMCEAIGVREPELLALPDYGRFYPSGITSSALDIVEDAFLPCRNLLFILSGAAYAYRRNATAVALGLLSESTALFPDQSDRFLERAEAAVRESLGRKIEILVPLRPFTKVDVVRIADELGVSGYYSCHAGKDVPCGECIACREYRLEGK